ncbi:MAG: amidohydrolase [Anaerolineales bacterium]
MSMHAERVIIARLIYPRATRAFRAQAMAVRQNRIIAVGHQQEMDPLIGPRTKVEELGDRVILPGLVDAHIHLANYANSLHAVDCQTKTLDECLQKLKQRAESSEPGTWILGHGWDQNSWGEWPTAAALDSVTPENPVYLTARSLHAGAANSLALKSLNIDASTPDPQGGRLQRDESGRPTGILFEGSAMKLVSRHISPPSVPELADRLRHAQDRLWSFGVVGAHDFDGAACLNALQILRAQDQLGLRVLKHIRVEYLDNAVELGLRAGLGDSWLKIGNIKIFTDGALGPRTAAMFDEYEDTSGNHGMLLLDADEILNIASRAKSAGYAMAIHAIGDRANEQALSALARLAHPSNQPTPLLPHRLEHLQLLRPQDMDRPANLGVIASMQPVHALSDQSMAERAWGERCRWSYAWRSILDSDAVLAFGSDAPVESPNPFWGIHAAVTRQQRAQPQMEPFIPEERISLESALTAYTKGPAIAAGEQQHLGSLEHGRLADFIVLASDPYEMDPAQLFDLKPEGTFVGGIWRSRNF